MDGVKNDIIDSMTCTCTLTVCTCTLYMCVCTFMNM